jgi:uncharacterized protein YcbK (DUF882 family)
MLSVGPVSLQASFGRATTRSLFLTLTLAAALLAPARAVTAGIGSDTSIPAQQHRLRLFNLHTNERIDIVYRRGDSYVAGSVEQLDHFLRDHRTGDVIALDPKLFDLLSDLTAAVGKPGTEIDIVCGYRTPSTNEFLRNTGHEVAKHSQHILGEAIDIRIPGVSTLRLRDAALGLHRGGVGYYPQSQFVHVDLGPARHWQAS